MSEKVWIIFANRHHYDEPTCLVETDEAFSEEEAVEIAKKLQGSLDRVTLFKHGQSNILYRDFTRDGGDTDWYE